MFISPTKEAIMNSTTSPTSIQPKELAIVPENAHQIQVYLDQMQSDAHAGMVNSEDIFRIAEEAESVLEKADIGKRYRAGAEYVKNPNVTKDRALRYRRLGTSINIKRRSKGWVLSSAQRKMIFPSQRGNSFMSLSNRQKEIVLHNLIVKYWISAPTIAKFLQGN